MAKQRIVKDSFWTDPYIEDLDPSEKLLFIYLLTNPLCNVAGVYEIKLKRIAYETGFDKDMVEKILERFEKDEKIIQKDSWIIICNFIKNQSTNPSILKGIERILKDLPTSVLQAVTASPQAGTYLTLLNLTLPNLTEERECVLVEPPKDTYKSKKQIADKKGIKLKQTPRSKKQDDSIDVMKDISYYRDQAMLIHGMQFLKVHSDARNKVVLKLAHTASKETNLRDLIDWWLDEGGEWAGYEPEQCFSPKIVERFLNTKNKKGDNYSC